jgi:hypothetical protein
MRIAFLSLLTILCLGLGSNSFAGTIYQDGPTLGTSNAIFIDGPGGPFGQSISDGFVAGTCTGCTGTGTGGEVYFAEWVLSGTVPTGVSYSIGGTNFTTPINPALGFMTTLLCTNGAPFNGGTCAGGFGYDVYQSQFNLTNNPNNSFTAGDTYWLTLTGATDNQHTGFNAWDINNGPATCDVEHGAIVQGGGVACGFAGESFTITGGQPTTPEPSSILLLGSGILGLAGVLRRKLTR